MDKYTRAAQRVNEEYYSRTHADGRYIPSEPLYGFRAEPPRGYILNYIRQHRLLRALSRFDFTSALDVGGGEGYSAALARDILTAPKKVELCDLSREACKRAGEIFGLKAYTADVHNLPFHDNSFDVVFSSETLEHVIDFQTAVREMVRVAKVAVVFTVPHESQETIVKSLSQGHIGDHINSFTREALVIELSPFGQVICEKLIAPLLIPFSVFVDATPRQYDQFHERSGYPRWLVALYNRMTRALSRLSGEKQAAWVVGLDRLVSTYLPWHNGILCTVIKRPASLHQPLHVNPGDIVSYRVPVHYLHVVKAKRSANGVSKRARRSTGQSRRTVA